jgi:hypothetical protein
MARSVADKLLIKSDSAVWTSDPARRGLIGPLPGGARSADGIRHATIALLFADDGASIRRLLDAHRDALTSPAVVWILYPKAGRTDINRDTLWPIVAEYGLRPITQVAVDDTWSALRFRPLRKDEAPFTGSRA